MSCHERIFKRAVDLIGSLLLLIILSPVLAGIALLIKVDSPGGSLFKQARVGIGGRPFTLLKFRTMVENAQNLGAGLFFEGENDPRITRLGRFLRNYSLDELPELWNVLLGEMSLVGPRPALAVVNEKLDTRQKQRLEVKPGLTGWAQINGRNSLTWSERVELDLWYINNYSFWLDFKILFKTLQVVILREGIRYDQAKQDVLDLDGKGSECGDRLEEKKKKD